MRWQASWMLQNSEPETFAAECACKRDKQMTIQVLLKASSFIKQERSECSVDRCCDWCDSLPAFLVHPSEIWVFRQQITTPATHHCKLWLLLVSWSMDKIPAVHPFFLIHGHIGLESMMCKVLSRQRVFMKQLLGHRVTLRSSPRQDDQNLNLVNSCVGPAETALVSSTCTVTGRSFQQVTWWPMKHRFIVFVSRNTGITKCSTGSWPWVNLSYFQCKDESDLFWRCLEYRAHACHVTESQRWTSVTAVSTDFGMVPNRLTAFFNASCGAIRCKNGLPQSYLSCFQNLYPTFGVKAESNMA